MKLKIGDIVKYRNGEVHYELIYFEPSRYLVKIRSLRSGQEFTTKHRNLIKVETKEEEAEMTTLYEFEGKYVTRLGNTLNSKGEWIVEVKGTGEVLAVDKGKLTEVVPYTVDIELFDEDTVKYGYISYEGQVSVDDILVIKSKYGTKFARVHEVDTKNRKAATELKEHLVGKVQINSV